MLQNFFPYVLLNIGGQVADEHVQFEVKFNTWLQMVVNRFFVVTAENITHFQTSTEDIVNELIRLFGSMQKSSFATQKLSAMLTYFQIITRAGHVSYVNCEHQEKNNKQLTKEARFTNHLQYDTSRQILQTFLRRTYVGSLILSKVHKETGMTQKAEVNKVALEEMLKLTPDGGFETIGFGIPEANQAATSSHQPTNSKQQPATSSQLTATNTKQQPTPCSQQPTTSNLQPTTCKLTTSANSSPLHVHRMTVLCKPTPLQSQDLYVCLHVHTHAPK